MTEDFLTEAFMSLKKRMRDFRGSGAGTSEDALQDAFCKLWGRKYALRSVGEAEALLSRTGKNLTIDAYRKAVRRPVESLEGKQFEDFSEDPRGKEALFRRVESSLETELSPVQRDIVCRHEYEGETFDQIAKDLRMQPAAVRMQISRARKALREKFRKEDEND